MLKPLTNILLKIFAKSFYQAHAPIFIFILYIIVAPGPPESIISFHTSVMLYFVAKPLIMMIVFGVLFLYTIKCWHFIAGKIHQVHQQFLFYSINSYTRPQQLIGWIILQTAVSIPILAYMLFSVIIAISHQYFLSALIILIYLAALLLLSALFYTWLIQKQINESKSSWILKLTKRFKKPLFTLYIYYVFDNLKIKYLIIKFLSYLIIIGVFLLFADVKTDIRVAAIAMLAIAASHSLLILDGRQFEVTFLTFTKALPISRLKLFISQLATYSVLLLPELIWLLFNVPPTQALGLYIFCLSIILFFANSLYLIGLDQEKYMKTVFFTFVIIFMTILFKLMSILTLINITLAYLIFYFNYYKFKEDPIALKYDD
ncbi:hypothetical protein [Pedobacter foliorum]|uniref:hypothetical protein n=1 Tax=Pedobacter foliorum TaxID=2739058 RepID=UPI00156772AF|nr:hypothetical protein [Pedobacter foliorum]NRF38194.1 hypothetical protein [Pedobacter foliorum]